MGFLIRGPKFVWVAPTNPVRTDRVANQTVQGATKQSSAFTAPAGDLIVVCAAAGREGSTAAGDITITDSVGLSWTEQTLSNVSGTTMTASIFTATSTGASMTVTVAMSTATGIGFRVDSVANWAAVTNAASGTVDYGTGPAVVTYGSAPATSSLCISVGHDSQPNYDHGVGFLDTTAGWSLIEFIEFQHPTDRWLQFKIMDRTGSASTTANISSTTNEHDGLIGVAIEITGA